MILFVVKGKKGIYPQIVLDGKQFYLKAQEVILGSNPYKVYSTLNEELNDLEIEVLEIDIEPNNINRELNKLYSTSAAIGQFYPIYDNTIKKHYSKFYAKQDFDFYLNLCDTYNVSFLTQIIYLFIYRNVSKDWVAAVFDLEIEEVEFILENLPIYYNYLDFNRRFELWHI